MSEQTNQFNQDETKYGNEDEARTSATRGARGTVLPLSFLSFSKHILNYEDTHISDRRLYGEME
jgi:hypothetical protein